MGAMWGWVDLKENGEINEIWYGRESETEGIDELPEWVKTKMAMLDFMDECIELPCGSYWYMLVNEEYENPLEPLKTYFICED